MKLSDIHKMDINALNLMVRDIAILTNKSEEDVIEEYYTLGNPSIFMQVVSDKSPITTIIGNMLKSKNTPKECLTSIYKLFKEVKS